MILIFLLVVREFEVFEREIIILNNSKLYSIIIFLIVWGTLLKSLLSTYFTFVIDFEGNMREYINLISGQIIAS